MPRSGVSSAELFAAYPTGISLITSQSEARKNEPIRKQDTKRNNKLQPS
jgi:hypothetical protein